VVRSHFNLIRLRVVNKIWNSNTLLDIQSNQWKLQKENSLEHVNNGRFFPKNNSIGSVKQHVVDSVYLKGYSKVTSVIHELIQNTTGSIFRHRETKFKLLYRLSVQVTAQSFSTRLAYIWTESKIAPKVDAIGSPVIFEQRFIV